MAELEKGKSQSAPAIMIHITASSMNGRAVLKPHFVPRGKMIAGQYYADVLEGDVFRQIDVLAGAKEWWWQQDLASACASQVAKELLIEGVKAAPWAPAGADCAPLDIFVNKSLKAEIRGRDVSDLPKLKK